MKQFLTPILAATISLTAGLASAQYSAPAGYYSSAAGLTGSSLRTALHNIIDGHTKLSYDAVWTALQTLDQHPTNTSAVLTIYSNEAIAKTARDGSTSATLKWNREHSWPKSYGFDTSSWPAYTDVHHLYASRTNYNSARGNKPFDNGGTSIWDAFNSVSDNRTDSDSWEPHNDVKGDLARSMFYMDVRYNGDTSNEPDLVLVDNVSMTVGQGRMGKLSTLITWHNNDPVSTREQRRNHLIYTNYQGNRNPFIDTPSYVANIWGGSVTTPTPTATPTPTPTATATATPTPTPTPTPTATPGGTTTVLLNTTTSVTTGSWRNFTVTIPTGTKSLVVTMTGSNGDADLYLKDSGLATLTSYDVRPYLDGSNETATATNPAAGSYYISVYGYAAATGLTLKAEAKK